MLSAGIEFASESAAEYLLKQAVGDSSKRHEQLSNEDQQFERRIRIAQRVLGMICPPAGRAMLLLEYGPIIAADLIHDTILSKRKGL